MIHVLLEVRNPDLENGKDKKKFKKERKSGNLLEQLNDLNSSPLGKDVDYKRGEGR